MNGAISRYVLALQRLFYFIASVSISFYNSYFFVEFYYLLKYWEKFLNT